MRVLRSKTLLITPRGTLVAKFGVKCLQIGANRNVIARESECHARRHPIATLASPPYAHWGGLATISPCAAPRVMSPPATPLPAGPSVSSLQARMSMPGRRTCGLMAGEDLASKHCHTCFSKENQVQTYMHARINFHAYSWHKWITETISCKKKGRLSEFTLNPGNEGTKLHKQSTGGCVRLAPATPSQDFRVASSF
jgi:hypothetical protein